MLSKNRLRKIKDVAVRRQDAMVILEDIHDPHNAAAVLRTCDSFGIQKVCFIQHQFPVRKNIKNMTLTEQIKLGDKIKYDETGAGFIFEKGEKFNPRKIGKATSSSANKWLDFEVFDSTEKCLKSLKKKGYKIFATILNDKAKSIFKTNFVQPKVALMLGNEHAGLSQKAVELSDAQIYIPMQGFVQSLNLSVTAAICMYELFRQRQLSTAKFSLTKNEQIKLIKNWKEK